MRDMWKRFLRFTVCVVLWIALLAVFCAGACFLSPCARIAWQIFCQTRHFAAGILDVFQGKITKYGRKYAVQAVYEEIGNRLQGTVNVR
ncbi:MAG: hypothetical protein IJT94_15740 [Oscillibacter sp.]|nr:hypothetical protein [Oscillibacter sp.]